MADQLIFNFPKKKIYLSEDYYVSSSNQEVYNFINSWPKWIKRICNIYGPKGSGKTHLTSLLRQKTSTLMIQCNSLNDKTFFDFKTKEALIIEDLNEKVSEKLLFSLWNFALQDNKYLLITSAKPINPKESGSLVKLYTSHSTIINCMDQTITNINRISRNMLNSLYLSAAYGSSLFSKN